MADNTIFDEWIEIAQNFKSKADAMLDEIRQYKQDMFLMRNEIMERLEAGQFIRDESRIVISAPEIIIGNVDHHGALQNGGRVIIKGSTVEHHGVGPGGKVNITAPLIQQIAIDRGIDGVERVVHEQSEIRTVGRQVHIESQDPAVVEGKGGYFVSTPSATGIQVLSDSTIRIDAAKKNKSKKKYIDDALTAMNRQKADYDVKAGGSEIVLKNLAKTINEKISKDEVLSANDDLGRANALALDEVAAVMEEEVNQFSHHLYNMAGYTAGLAEAKRAIACLEKEKSDMPSEDDYKKNGNGSLLVLQGENIDILSRDGEGNVRTNEDSGIKIQGNNIELFSTMEDGKLTPAEAKGRINVRSRNVSISTDDFVDGEFKNGDLEKGKFPLVGNVTIMSKAINMTAVDMETDKGKFKETKLTEGSEVNIRAEKVKVKTIDEKGKSVGKFSVNSQRIALKATDIKDYKTDIELDDQGNPKQPEMHSDKVAADSKMLLLAETMNIGYKKDELETKTLYLSSTDNVLINSKSHVQLTQGTRGSADVTIDMSGQNLEATAGGNTVVEGDGGLTLYGDTTINGAVKAGDVEVANLNASKSVSAPNLTDGISTPAPAQKNSGKKKGDKFEESQE